MKLSLIKIWISYAKFELEQENGIEMARNIFEKAAKYYKEYLNEEKDEEIVSQRIALLKAWEEYEVIILK